MLHSTKYHLIFVISNQKNHLKSRVHISKIVSFSAILIALGNLTSAQSRQDSLVKAELTKEIAHMDSVLFEAFNTQVLAMLKTLFTGDLEFYHDLGGLTGYQENMESFKNTFEKNNGLKRELINGSLEVYPIKGYGAIQTGEHRFCHVENGKEECGTFKFVHIWQKKDGQWKIARVVSYGH